MDFEELNKKHAEFTEALHLIDDGDFKRWFPLTHNGTEYKNIEQCIIIYYTDDKNPMMTYHDRVGAALPGELRVLLEKTLCKSFPDGFYNGHRCD